MNYGPERYCKMVAVALRILVSIAAILVPLVFLFKGIFGSFIFTFSTPLIWQFGFLGKPISSLASS